MEQIQTQDQTFEPKSTAPKKKKIITCKRFQQTYQSLQELQWLDVVYL